MRKGREGSDERSRGVEPRHVVRSISVLALDRHGASEWTPGGSSGFLLAALDRSAPRSFSWPWPTWLDRRARPRTMSVEFISGCLLVSLRHLQTSGYSLTFAITYFDCRKICIYDAFSYTELLERAVVIIIENYK